MQRIEKIYQYVQSKEFATTLNVAEALEIQRSNASKDLNELVKAGRLNKTTNRPVQYYVNPDYQDAKAHEVQKPSERVDVFSRVIGASGSMRNAVEQAKAAILYPPHGLNCLITGPTGSGKTFFAHAMFQFAQSQGIIADDQELITFNCADYANNSELLMSHLFGYIKGAFTGAEADTEGLIQKADGGMLFLDEIHRLPPEGQEMIFYFMDYGSYNRLGETGKNHFADVRIVGATTEDLHSFLLDTFLRRIPINIQMPPFANRPPSEQIDLVRVMVAIESNRIQRKITLTEDVVKALLGSVSYGNIGQLKSNVQLICARGFMNHMNKREINITLNDLSDGIKSGLVQLSADRLKSTDISPYLEPIMTITPNVMDQLIQTDTYELPYNLYDIIGDKATILKKEGLDQEAINHYISTDINVHLKSFYKDHGFSFNTETRLAELVDKHIIEISNQIMEIAEKELSSIFQPNFIYAMSLHLSSLLKKIQIGEIRQTNDNIREMATNYPKEFAVAQKIRTLAANEFEVDISESEAYYLTVLLVSLREETPMGKIGIVVSAHGNSTASSMAQVVRDLLDIQNIKAIDMPLDMHPKIAYGKLKEAVLQADEGSGVLLMVDMGSLATFNNELEKETQVKVRTLDMVTTSLLLEAARKSTLLGSNIDELYELLQTFKGYSNRQETKERLAPQLEKQAILAICASGEGTAMRLKEIIERPLKRKAIKNIEVITLSVTEIKEKIPSLKLEYQIIATTGIIDPKIGVPYIPIDKFINQNPNEIIDQLLLNGNLDNQLSVELTLDKARSLCIDFMEKNFTFINSQKLIEPLWTTVNQLVVDDQKADTYAKMMNLTMHLAGAVERAALKQPLLLDAQTLDHFKAFKAQDNFDEKLNALESELNLTLNEAERYYIYKIINPIDTVGQ
ncbi:MULTISPECIES: sigma 54-interacting transcriptional regulator [unclassified Enterococcus]|uniref:sigma-54-dependent transcriptional regulator n=1 Tax=unclassified Enterococcus TaxID=2608891 RepID=UPI001551C1B7|nr:MULTISPECIES: sigma 54-interacting transcriptional regulator [unclassified Enterococcus]MBS7577397.1 sigma 54-interacting transcriptional regulator [Enterococcus sp. MMGLQ5-2]MBS7584804.1 sigma 54-interacting transcriptional regulator [Enterococcus sp. MMGLQ5-1]NPD12659.1 sigma 54-interacting transcriptional regulator [Enterococcus sp. MMGLQ5-1]NPD37231.1 sigma 54-interacting transcriptional regulator [Enterococcus sp. MMGLQ5-2]